MYSSQGLDLDILPSGSPSVIRRYRQSIETETFRTAGNVRNRGIHLPVRGGAIALGASDEALGALALVGEVSEWRAGAVDKGTGRGARGDGARVSGGEAEGTAGVNVDALAAGDGDVQGVRAGEPGGGAWGAAADLLDGLRAEGGGGLAEPEVAVGCIHGEQVDGRAGAGGHDGEFRAVAGVVAVAVAVAIVADGDADGRGQGEE